MADHGAERADGGYVIRWTFKHYNLALCDWWRSGWTHVGRAEFMRDGRRIVKPLYRFMTPSEPPIRFYRQGVWPEDPNAQPPAPEPAIRPAVWVALVLALLVWWLA